MAKADMSPRKSLLPAFEPPWEHMNGNNWLPIENDLRFASSIASWLGICQPVRLGAEIFESRFAAKSRDHRVIADDLELRIGNIPMSTLASKFCIFAPAL